MLCHLRYSPQFLRRIASTPFLVRHEFSMIRDNGTRALLIITFVFISCFSFMDVSSQVNQVLDARFPEGFRNSPFSQKADKHNPTQSKEKHVCHGLVKLVFEIPTLSVLRLHLLGLGVSTRVRNMSCDRFKLYYVHTTAISSRHQLH